MDRDEKETTFLTSQVSNLKLPSNAKQNRFLQFSFQNIATKPTLVLPMTSHSLIMLQSSSCLPLAMEGYLAIFIAFTGYLRSHWVGEKLKHSVTVWWPPTQGSMSLKTMATVSFTGQ